jgi:hypothetical protein
MRGIEKDKVKEVLEREIFGQWQGTEQKLKLIE